MILGPLNFYITIVDVKSFKRQKHVETVYKNL